MAQPGPGGGPLAFPSPLGVHRCGAGEPPVVLVHGFGASNHSWRHWIPALSRKHTVHAVELMGFGGAAAPPGGDYSPRAQAGHLVELLRRLPGPPPVLVGHSLGGCIILLAALRLADEGGAVPLAGLVVMSGPVFPQKLPPFLTLARTPGIGELLLAAPPPRWALRAGIRGIVERKETVTPEQVDGYRAPLLERARRRAILRAARQIQPEEADEIATRYPEITLPTLILWGAGDPVVPPAFAPRLEEAMPRARRVILPGVGHLPAEEAPQASLDAVLAFLDSL
ncbi:MAG: alpha/beta hydrolase [Gemmatimonadales bacterium]|nr:MAG: alpha/beta hydrolase [Gemmatimonadales bacterium]